jgi:hypothetical protein
MKTKSFLLLCLISGIGFTQLFSQKNSRQEVFTKLGEPAPVQDKLNGRVEKVVFKIYWGKGTGEKIAKGNHITARERDSLGWFYDFEAVFDNVGDHIIYYNTLNDNDKPVTKYHFIRENNKIVLSKWTLGKVTKMAFGGYSATNGCTKYIYNEKGLLIKKEDCLAVNDSLLYSFTIKCNEAADEIETQAYDGKGNFLRKWSTEYNDKSMPIGGIYYGQDGNIASLYKYTYNDKGKISEMTMFNKENMVTGNAKYTYLEYDSNGNWIKCGLEYGPFTTYSERTITYFK